MSDDVPARDHEIERIAQAIYRTHWRSPSPAWNDASDAVQGWVREQAINARSAMLGQDLNDEIPF